MPPEALWPVKISLLLVVAAALAFGCSVRGLPCSYQVSLGVLMTAATTGLWLTNRLDAGSVRPCLQTGEDIISYGYRQEFALFLWALIMIWCNLRSRKTSHPHQSALRSKGLNLGLHAHVQIVRHKLEFLHCDQASYNCTLVTEQHYQTTNKTIRLPRSERTATAMGIERTIEATFLVMKDISIKIFIYIFLFRFARELNKKAITRNAMHAPL